MSKMKAGSQSEGTKNPADTERAKRVVMRLYEEVYAKGNVNELDDIVARDEDLVYYGTDAPEKFVGFKTLKVALESIFASISSFKVEWKTPPQVKTRGDVAWYSGDLLIHGIWKDGTAVDFALRCTGVLEKQDKRWLIVMHHHSVGRERPMVRYMSRIQTGYRELDRMLYGGIPENFAVLLSAPSCDEKSLIVKRFVESGLDLGFATAHITSEVPRYKKLAEKFPQTYRIVGCGPQAESGAASLPNLFEAGPLENLTQLNLAVNEAVSKIPEQLRYQMRLCLEVTSDVLLRHRALVTRKWLAEFIAKTKNSAFTILATLDPSIHGQDEINAVSGLFDGQIDLYKREKKGAVRTYLRIRKMYEQSYDENELAVEKNRI